MPFFGQTLQTLINDKFVHTLLSGNDNKTVKIMFNNLTVLCENLWPILYYLGDPLLALSSCSSRTYRKSTNSKSVALVCFMDFSYSYSNGFVVITN